MTFLKRREDGSFNGQRIIETNLNIEIAKKMLEKNMDINTISEITGLTTEEITNLNSN